MFGPTRCPQLRAAIHAVDLLGVDPALLSPAHHRCYCGACEPEPRMRRDGEGCIPCGYSRVAISVSPATCMARNVFLWPKGFHGSVKIENVAAIVQTGHLLTPGSTTFDGREISVMDGHIEKKGDNPGSARKVTLDALRTGRIGNAMDLIPVRTGGGMVEELFAPWTCVFMTPTHVYAECAVYTKEGKMPEGSDVPEEVAALRGVKVRCLLEIRIARGTFDVGPHTVSHRLLAELNQKKTPFCKDSDQWEWYTRRYGRMVVTGVLVQFPGLNREQMVRLNERLPDPRGWGVRGLVAKDALADVVNGARLDTAAVQKFTECPHAELALEAASRLGVSIMLFDHRHNMCYCERRSFCKHATRMYKRAGQAYYLPKGYTRLAVRIDDARCEADQMWDSWPVAFHGTTLSTARSVLECGQLLPKGAFAASGQPVVARDTDGTPVEPEELLTLRNNDGIFFSPVADYAANPKFAKPQRMLLNGEVREVSVVLQLRVRPGYEKGPSTVAGFVPPAGCEYGDQLEWSTKRHASVMVYGVLFKITDAVDGDSAASASGSSVASASPSPSRAGVAAAAVEEE